MATKGYRAKRGIDIDLLKGDWIDGIQFTITATGGGAYDFSAATGFNLVIYNKANRVKNRTVLVTVVEGAGLEEASGVITWDAVFPSELTFGKYNFELQWTEASETPKFIAEGTLNII